MPPQFQGSLPSIALILFAGLTQIPFLLSILSWSSEFKGHPLARFFLFLSSWWLSYWIARTYIRLAELSSPLYHPLGCLAQCVNWVFHWVLAIYFAFFVNKYSLSSYLTTVFCLAVVIFSEGLFHSLITIECKDTENLGVYEDARKRFGRCRLGCVGQNMVFELGRNFFASSAGAVTHANQNHEHVKTLKSGPPVLVHQRLSCPPVQVRGLLRSLGDGGGAGDFEGMHRARGLVDHAVFHHMCPNCNTTQRGHTKNVSCSSFLLSLPCCIYDSLPCNLIRNM